eukprot:2775317-Prymnesium_polylepis.1
MSQRTEPHATVRLPGSRYVPYTERWYVYLVLEQRSPATFPRYNLHTSSGLPSEVFRTAKVGPPAGSAHYISRVSGAL